MYIYNKNKVIYIASNNVDKSQLIILDLTNNKIQNVAINKDVQDFTLYVPPQGLSDSDILELIKNINVALLKDAKSDYIVYKKRAPLNKSNFSTVSEFRFSD